MSTEDFRKPINATLRQQVYARDQHCCQKCYKTKKLEIHHIIPLSSGEQIDTLENLITLCNRCHDEWDMIFTRTKGVDFHAWLKIPPAIHIIAAFAREEWWKDEFTAKQTRDGIIHAYAIAREMMQWPENQEDEESDD
jgi:hypothetical protein